MDLLKQLTGKNPAEYEQAAKILVDSPDVELFKKLVNQEDYLFDFVKVNVAKRIRQACTKDNYKNLFQFLDFYSPSYDEIIADVLYSFGNNDTKLKMKGLLLNGSSAQKTYAVKYFKFLENEEIQSILEPLREYANSDNEFLASNSIEVLSKNRDDVSKNRAIDKLSSTDEFEQYSAVKFLVTYGAKETVPQIIDVMKHSSLSENIASEIPYLIDLEELIEKNSEDAILVLCNIINAIPEIIPLSAVIEYGLTNILKKFYYENLTSTSALLLRMAKDKFLLLEENEEYLFDCDKNTKEEVGNLISFIKKVNENKLSSLFYDELYEGSDFVLFALDYVKEIEVLESLLDSTNQTLILKVLTELKEKNALTAFHKELALRQITNKDIEKIVEAM